MDRFEKNFINDIKRENTNALIEMFKDGLSFYSSEEIAIIKGELILRDVNIDEITESENNDSNLFDESSIANQEITMDDEENFKEELKIETTEEKIKQVQQHFDDKLKSLKKQ